MHQKGTSLSTETDVPFAREGRPFLELRTFSSDKEAPSHIQHRQGSTTHNYLIL